MGLTVVPIPVPCAPNQLRGRSSTCRLVRHRTNGSVYAEPMEMFSLIISLAAETAKLAGTLVADGIRYIALLAPPRSAVAAENLLLRRKTRLTLGAQNQTATFRQRHAVSAGAALSGLRITTCAGERHAQDLHRLASCRFSLVSALEVTARMAKIGRAPSELQSQ